MRAIAAFFLLTLISINSFAWPVDEGSYPPANIGWSIYGSSSCTTSSGELSSRLSACNALQDRVCTISQRNPSTGLGGCNDGYGKLVYSSTSTTPPCNEGDTFNPQTGSCVPAPCDPPNVLNSTGQCLTPEDQCIDSPNPPKCECELNGGGWLELGGSGECTSSPDDCDSSSPDYMGTVNDIPVCDPDSNCQAGETYGLVNDQPVCIPPDHGPPDCDFQTVAVAVGENGDGGFTCAPPNNQPEPPQPPDSDGDGTPDSNDPDSNDSDGDGTPDSQEGGDHDGDGIANSDDPQYQNQYGQGAAAQASRENGSKIDQTNEALNDLNQQIQNQNLTLDDMKQSLSGIDDNISELADHVTADSTATDGLLDGVQTVSESNQAIADAWQNHPTIAAFSQIPTLAVNNSCPVFEVPSTQYWSAIPLTIICEVLEDNRAILSLLFMGLWTLAAASIFMRA